MTDDPSVRRDETRAAAVDTLMRSLVSIGVTCAVLAAMHPAVAIRAKGLWARAAGRGRGRRAAEELAVSELRADVSRWEHRP